MHTPGPWEIRLGPPSWNETNNGGDVWCIQINMPRSGNPEYNHANTWAPTIKRVEADARLIAAAPDLLAAAKEAMKIENFGVAGLIKLRAAIAKAEGK